MNCKGKYLIAQKDGLLFDDPDKAAKSSQKVARIFRTRTMGVMPRIEVVAA